jgi:hypothetical protein
VQNTLDTIKGVVYNLASLYETKNFTKQDASTEMVEKLHSLHEVNRVEKDLKIGLKILLTRAKSGCKISDQVEMHGFR